jgi:Flp pilus assembly protein TadD
LRPDFPDTHYNLGIALSRKGDFDGAIVQWRATLALRPNDPGTNTSLANALVQKGSYHEAVAHYEITLRSEPNSEMPLNNLAWVLAAAPDESVRNGTRAVDIALRLTRVTQNKNPFYIRTLAAAYAEAGQFDKAVDAGERASGAAHAQGQDKLAAKIEVETDLYREHKAYRDPTLPNGQ